MWLAKTRFFISFLGLFQEWHDLERMQEGNAKIREESMSWRLKYESLKKFAIENEIPIPAELDAV